MDNFDDLFAAGEPSSALPSPSSGVTPGFSVLAQQVASLVVAQLKPLLTDRVHPASSVEEEESIQAQINRLQAQLDLMQLRQEKLQRQIRNYEDEIEQLNAEKRYLEQGLQDLPEIYRQKFQARLRPVRERIQQIQSENFRLRADLQELSHCLRRQQMEELDPPHWSLRLPQFPKLGRRNPALPSPTDSLEE